MDDPMTLPFEAFWSWLVNHPNCILRAGTPETVLYDDEDLHWTFASEGATTLVVQLVRGKRLAGELWLEPEQVTYVQGYSSDREGEWVFECILENEKEPVATYFFVLTHGYDEGEEEEGFAGARVH